MHGTDRLSALIDDIYDCAAAPARWRETLVKVARTVRCERVLLSLKDFRQDRILVEASVGCEPQWLAERDSHLPEFDAALASRRAGGRDGDEPFVASRDIPRDVAGRSACFRDWLAPRGVGDVLYFSVIRAQQHASDFVLARRSGSDPFGRREIELGKRLVPHLRRAMTINGVLDARNAERRRMALALDAVRCGVLLTDANGTVVYANRAAERTLRDGRWLDCGLRLRAKRTAADRELQRAIRPQVRGEAADGGDRTAIRLSANDESPVLAHVLRLAAGGLRTEAAAEAVAAVFVSASRDETDGVGPFAAAYGLTRAETRLASILVTGRTLTETARVLGVGRATAKTQLESVCRKAGVSRQGELIRLMTQGFPVA